MIIQVDPDKCIGCGTCRADCPTANIAIKDGKAVHGKWCLECGHCLAVCPEKAVLFTGDYDPSEVLEYDDPKKFEIAPDRLLNFVKFRRSVRQYTDEPVSDADIAKILEMGRYTQTGANTQTLRYIVLTKETLREITPIALKTLAELDIRQVDKKTMRVPSQYLDFQPIWANWHSFYQKKQRDSLFHGAPNALLIVSRTCNEVDGCFNAGHLELMINALGLGACLMGFGTFAFDRSPELRQKVGIQEGESVIFMMVFGHPKVKYLRTVNRRKVRYEKI
ncbi:MAG: nitroreductase family protein [Smithellaceae bacterium]|jgi:nitroreductase/NAD-dependent dihydropyrimidine dehydrogenase PreA subunit|nr:nitroreductase family protein [Smithellaceae bacterium]MDD3258213.1 nitroreductase family protein [Smithellaceae bacterium]MDD3849411.1 nitroreductase family protein [Smithellaceae bacterium]HOG12537.1 nitroreductase family protein [Smithellaceae bacterium]HPL10312.1 nitroreductase family protein [Smithellaceae bacterium]